MAMISEQQRARWASLPKAEKVRDMIAEYLLRSQLELKDFARRCGYSYSAVRHFNQGSYHKIAANDGPLREAVLKFIEQHPVGQLEVAEGKLYETENVRLMRKYFYEALDNRRAYFVEGDPGTQKSYVLQHLIYELNQREIAKNGHGRRAFYVYCRQGIRPVQLLKRVAEAAGTIVQGDTDRILRNLRFDYRSRKALFIFDEAQHLDIQCLETVRELLDQSPHFGLLFAGSHNFGEMFKKKALQLEQWNSRFHAGKQLPGIAKDEAAVIIRGELGGKANAAVIDALVKKSQAAHLRSGNGETYVSARRLFEALADLKKPVAKGATA